MKWIARLLAVLFAAAAVYLVVANVHAPQLVLELVLGAAALSIICVVLLWRAPRTAAILNAVWIVAAFVATLVLGHSAPGGTSIAAGASPEPAAQADAQLNQAVQAALPEDYVLAARAAKLPTIDAAFAYVRDDIGFESYQGILRGAKGTFYSRAGNALDRAMLLASILQSNKIPVRLVTGTLPPAQSEQLYARIFESAPSPQPSSPPGPQVAAIFDRAHRDFDTISGALGGSLPAVSIPSHDDVIKEISQHAWVQAQRDGQWVDLDPSFPDSTVGHAYTTVQQTYDAPPAPLMQQVTVRVIAETVSNGTLAQQTVLEKTAPAYQIVDEQVYLMHQPYQPFNGQGGNLQYIFGNKDVMQPVLFAGGRKTVGTQIDFGSGASPTGTSAPNSVQQAVSAFGTPSPGPGNANATAFVAEWLEFEIDFPDGRKDVTRRALIDRAGTAWRHAATHDASTLHDLARVKNELVAPQAVYNIWFSAGKHNALAFALGAQQYDSGTIPVEHPDAPTLLDKLWPFALRDLSWLMVSDHILVPSINDTPGLRLYADSPRIFVWSVGPDPSGKPDSIVMESDLRRDSLRAVARDSTAQGAVAQHKVWFGALEGALEHELGTPQNAGPGAEYITTSSLADSGGVTVLSPGSSPTASDPETQARIAAALANGDTLVVPKAVLAGGMSGWWQIEHGTGDVRAVLDDDLDGGFTRGGFPNPKPPPGFGPQRYNPIKGPIGEQQAYYAELEQEFEPVEELYEKALVGLEPGEDRGASGTIVITAGQALIGVASIVAAVAGIAYEILK